MPLDPSPKIGYDLGGVYQDVSTLSPLPMGSGESVETTLTISSLAATTPIDTRGYRWATIFMSAGYSGMTSLTAQCNSDNGATWFSWSLVGTGDTASGITSSMGTSAKIWHGPIPSRYIRFNPAGTYTSGSCVLKVILYSQPLWMPSSGSNANIAAVGGSIMPAVSTSTMTLGTATGNSWQARITNTVPVAATTLLAAVSGQMPYLTDLNWTYVGTGNPILTLQAAANALIPMEIIMEPNKSDNISLRHPHKFMSTTNNILQYVVTGTFTGTFYFTARGYYQSS